ncbi:polysialyltransferase family glycosyltransferase [Mesobacillus jeotgali]|uniref:Uncharacterized protein n=1 Tax=Mesobacillus jeotgali TaxID=129985 RepID=A0ABY9VG42_9BACI|nr:polysialyltransferase family glycosyltransferase [Mesobacillus jeotgali]WNF22665.1 hypothetical protein RH061_21325 [Mesobacillus jeotgali]
MKKNAFVCCTPYHIILSYHLIKNHYKGFSNDIYISDHFPNSEEIYHNIKKENLFENVYFITDKKLSYMSLYERRKHKKYKQKIEKDWEERINFKQYNRLSFFTFSYFSKYFFSRSYSFNEKPEVFFIEDGVGTYINFSTRKEKMRNLISKSLPRRNILSGANVDFFGFFYPKGAIGINKKNIFQMDNVFFYDYDITVLNRIFNYTPSEIYKNKKMIFIDQPFKDREKKILKKKIFDILKTQYETQYIIKVHPRDIEIQELSKNYCIDARGVPIELLILNNEINKDSKLIGINSTALLTPKIMMGWKNEILSLYKMTNLKGELYNIFFESIDFNIKTPTKMSELKGLLKE